MSVPRPGHLRGLAAALAAVLGAGVLPALSPTAAAADPAPRQATALAAGTPHRITLITGDVVHFTDGPRPAVIVESAADGLAAVSTEHHGDDFYVIPSAVRPLIAADTVDKELFNVRRLVRDGHAGGPTPVIVTHAAALPATAATTPLPAINGHATHVDPARAREFWTAARAANATVWLDRRLRVSLDTSVPMVGAPAAWRAGRDGTGVRVAVLDTGADGTHPDLAGKITATRDFTGAGSTADGHGHGTHVASTIAGTGAASGGRFTGVAPGASLLVGKVCDDGGECAASAILAGMEWAARSGARVVNLSLGGEPTDGRDPLSQAVNRLTVQAGALFVVAAGNAGCPTCVSTPAVADQALAVGAVDKSDRLAPFSSQGPRAGDGAVKPEIVAPGVAITAARAAGTSMGTPADDRYTRASGTSMATPHVAGAAAILAQARPGARAPALKAALVNTSKDDLLPVFAQGAGRLDVARALASPAHGPLPVNYRTLTRVTTRVLSYVNTGDRPVTLALGVSLTTTGGQPAPAGTAKLAASTVTVPARSAGGTTLTINPYAAPPGTYGGVVTATSADGRVALRTPVSYQRVAPTTRLTVKVLDFAGKPSAGTDFAWLFGGGKDYALPVKNGTGTVDVPAGTYTVLTTVRQPEQKRTAWVAETNRTIGARTEVVLDARTAVPAKAVAPEPAEELHHGMSLSVTYGQAAYTSSGRVEPGWQAFATPASAVTGDDRVVLQDNYTLKAGNAIYNLSYSQEDGIPSTLEHKVDPAGLHKIQTRYHADGAGLTLLRAWYGLRKDAPAALHRPDVRLPAPAALTEYVNRDDAIAWTRYVHLSDGTSTYALFNRQPFGDNESWFSGPVAPAAPGFLRRSGAAGEVFWPHRHINDSDLDHVLDADAGGDYPVTWRLFRGDTEIPRRAVPGSQVPEFPMPDEAASYRLQSSMVLKPTARYAPSLATRAHSPRVDTEWVFTSGKATGTACAIAGFWPTCDYQPALRLAYDLGLDLANRAPAGTAHTFRVTAAHQRDAVGAAPVSGLKLAYSTDNGTTWTVAPVTPLGDGGFQVTVVNPPAGGIVWLRTEATDTAGNKITQTVQKAYTTA